MKKQLFLQFLSAMLLTLALAFIVSCSNDLIQSPTPKSETHSGARTTVLAPGYLSGHWKLSAMYSSYAPYNKTSYQNQLGCSLSDRWIYISPSNYTIQITNRNGCRNVWNSWSQPPIDYFAVSNQAYEKVTYGFAPDSGDGYALFDLYRGSPSTGANVYYTKVTWNAPYYTQMTLQDYNGYFAAVYERPAATDTPPQIY